MKEAELQQSVIDYAHLAGWIVAHFPKSQNSKGAWLTSFAADSRGFPDLVLVRERVVYVELKSQAGKTTEEQDAWIARLKSAGQEVYVWKPKDWNSGLVTDTLKPPSSMDRLVAASSGDLEHALRVGRVTGSVPRPE